MVYLQLGWFVIMVTVAACAPKHQDSKFVFRTWMNQTGWDNNVICFITGLVNSLYAVSGLDGVTVRSKSACYKWPNVNRSFLACHRGNS